MDRLQPTTPSKRKEFLTEDHTCDQKILKLENFYCTLTQ